LVFVFWFEDYFELGISGSALLAEVALYEFGLLLGHLHAVTVIPLFTVVATAKKSFMNYEIVLKIVKVWTFKNPDNTVSHVSSKKIRRGDGDS
jgi:hypothetical protein